MQTTDTKDYEDQVQTLYRSERYQVDYKELYVEIYRQQTQRTTRTRNRHYTDLKGIRQTTTKNYMQRYIGIRHN